MQSMNSRMNLPEMQKIMTEFAKQTEMMDMKEEMMSDMLDDTFADEDDEDEEDSLVNQVLDEIGLDMKNSINAADSKIKKPVAANAAAAQEEPEDDLQARLENLKKN